MGHQAHPTVNVTTQTDAENDALPFRTDETDVHEGIGVIVEIHELADHTDGRGVTDDGRCQWCGYDRGTWRRHTEVAGEVVNCRECRAKVADTEEP